MMQYKCVYFRIWLGIWVITLFSILSILSPLLYDVNITHIFMSLLNILIALNLINHLEEHSFVTFKDYKNIFLINHIDL